jgi:transposase-like protein
LPARRRWPLKVAAVAQLDAGRSMYEITTEFGITTPWRIWHWRAELSRDDGAATAEHRRQRQLDAECRAATLAEIRRYDVCRARRAWA